MPVNKHVKHISIRKRVTVACGRVQTLSNYPTAQICYFSTPIHLSRPFSPLLSIFKFSSRNTHRAKIKSLKYYFILPKNTIQVGPSHQNSSFNSTPTIFPPKTRRFTPIISPFLSSKSSGGHSPSIPTTFPPHSLYPFLHHQFIIHHGRKNLLRYCTFLFLFFYFI